MPVQNGKKKYTWNYNNKLFANQYFTSTNSLILMVNQQNIRNVNTAKIEVKVFSDNGNTEKVFDLQDFIKVNNKELTKEDFGLEY